MSERECSRDYSVFEYMYRDGGNWKTYGKLLLTGDSDGLRETLQGFLESGDLFIAEQVEVPSLCEEHFSACGEGPSDLDHAYHELVDLRPATTEEKTTLPPAGSLAELMRRFQAVAGRWDVRLSPNCWL